MFIQNVVEPLSKSGQSSFHFVGVCLQSEATSLEILYGRWLILKCVWKLKKIRDIFLYLSVVVTV